MTNKQRSLLAAMIILVAFLTALAIVTRDQSQTGVTRNPNMLDKKGETGLYPEGEKTSPSPISEEPQT